MREVDVTHLQASRLADPQRGCCQDHHAVTPGLMTTPLHGFLDQPAQRAHVWQGEIAGTLLSLYRRRRPTDDTPPSPILCRVAHEQSIAHRLVQHKHQGRDRVLNRGTTVCRFPLVDGPIASVP